MPAVSIFNITGGNPQSVGPGETSLAQDTTKHTVVLAENGLTSYELVEKAAPQTLTSKTLTAPVITNPTFSGQTPLNVTGSTVTLGATHVGRTTTLSRAAGIAVTLPAASGSGDKYDLVVAVTFTGASTVAVASGTDYMIGVAQMGIDGGTFVPHQYPTANTGTVATESDTISMFGTANSTGGFKGARVHLQDIAANIWSVLYISDAGGTEATPFSAAV